MKTIILLLSLTVMTLSSCDKSLTTDSETEDQQQAIEGTKQTTADTADQKGGKHGRCFEFVYPVTFTMPDASTITVADEAGFSAIRDWYKANPDSKEKGKVNLPVDITTKDGTTKTISTEDELKAAKQECPKRKGHGKRCFEFVYPVTFTMPDASTITVADKDGFSAIRDWHKANPDSKEKGKVNLPVDITTKDGTTKTISTEDELKAAKQECPKRKGHGKRCFEFVYPVTFTMPDASTITVADKDGFSAIRDWHKANPDSKEKAKVNLPVDITTKDGTTKTISTEDELKAAKQECGGKRRGKRKR